MMDPLQFERLAWIASRFSNLGERPPTPPFGRTTWPQEVSEAAQAAVDEIERLVDLLERDAQS